MDGIESQAGVASQVWEAELLREVRRIDATGKAPSLTKDSRLEQWRYVGKYVLKCGRVRFASNRGLQWMVVASCGCDGFLLGTT